MSRAIICPSCGGTIAVKAVGYTVSVACQYCGSVLDVAHPDVKIIAEYHEAAARLDLPLGSRGVLFGAQWEAIGWLARAAGGYGWQEYLLLNPYAGYRWLVESGGEWQFGQMLTARPEPVPGGWGWAGRRFAPEEGGATITTARVLGEFYWRVRAGDAVDAESFVSEDGQSLSLERTGDEEQWTHLVPVPRRWIDDFTRPQGPDLAHPTPERPKPQPRPSWFDRLWRQRPASAENDLWIMAGLALVTVSLAMLVLAWQGAATGSASGRGSVVVDGPVAHLSVGPVTVARPQQFVSVQVATSSFVNQWVDLDYRLVNRATQAALPASATVEFYAGRDSDGDWSEGSHEASTTFSQVPAGQYDLMVEAQAHRWNDPAQAGFAAAPEPFAIESIDLAFLLEAGGMPWGVWWLAVAALGLPVLAWAAFRASMTA